MRFPKLPVRKEDPEVFDDASSRGEVSGPPSPTGFQSPVGPALSPPPLTSDLTRSIRFSVSEPQGYFFDQVENFVEQVVEALTYYEQVEFQYRQTIYEMQVDMDHQSFDLQRLRSEIELFKVQGSPLVNPDGTYVTESQQSANEAYAEQVSEYSAEITRLTDLVAVQEEEIGSLRQWGDQVIEEVGSLRAHITALEAENDALRVETSAPSLDRELGSPDLEDPALEAEDVSAWADEEVESALSAPEEQIVVDTAVADSGVGVDHSNDAYIPVIEIPMSQGAGLESLSEDDDDLAEPDEQDDPSDFEESNEFGDVDDDPSPLPHPLAGGISAAETAVASVGSLELGPAEVEVLPVSDAVEVPAEESVVDDHAYVEDADPVAEEPVAPADGYTDDASFDRAHEGSEDLFEDADEEGRSVAVVPVDTELPVGAELPGTGEAAIFYPPAAPGLPLDTRGVPVEVWAPELNPALQEIAED